MPPFCPASRGRLSPPPTTACHGVMCYVLASARPKSWLASTPHRRIPVHASWVHGHVSDTARATTSGGARDRGMASAVQPHGTQQATHLAAVGERAVAGRPPRFVRPASRDPDTPADLGRRDWCELERRIGVPTDLPTSWPCCASYASAAASWARGPPIVAAVEMFGDSSSRTVVRCTCCLLIAGSDGLTLRLSPSENREPVDRGDAALSLPESQPSMSPSMALLAL